MATTNNIFSANISPLIEEEVARVAADAYTQDGISLYDHIVLKKRDANTIKRYVEDAINTIVSQTETLSNRTTSGNLEIINPDLDPIQEQYAVQELTRFVVLNVTSAWLQDKYADRAPEYAQRAQAALNKAITILHQRQEPTRE